MNRKAIFFVIFILLFSVMIVHAVPNDDKAKKDKHKDKKNEDINQKKCQECHQYGIGNAAIDKIDITTKGNIKEKQVKTSAIQSISSSTLRSTSTSGNYTTILEVGQTPSQLGFAFNGAYTGWQWWDTDGFGSEEQKNLVILTILDNSSGTAKLVPGLVSLPTWPQASYRTHGGTYSYKADTDLSPISTQNNYSDKTEIWMAREVNLTDVSSATLTFWTWYSMEIDWDYGYIAVSTDGNNWTNLQGTLTTNNNPNGNNLGNGITGSSGGNWVQETMDLTPYVGNKILLGFRFKSDDATNEEGWYVDDITVSGNVFSDDAETLPEIKTLSVNVAYPKLIITGATDPLTPSASLAYSQGVQQVNLQEYLDHPGTYYGYFKSGTFAQQYSGDYVVSLDTIIGSTPISATAQSKTTTYGCQNCHNKKLDTNAETSYVHGEGGGMQSCSYVCHAGSRGLYGDGFMGPPIDANPMHVHEMIYGHQGGFLSGIYYAQPPYNVEAHVNLSCQQCHTSFINDNNGPDTMGVASYLLRGTNMAYSSGTHGSLTCQNCHGDLTYPNIPQSQYELSRTLGSYTPTFTSSRSFTDTFVTDVDGTNNLTLSVTGDTNKRIALYVIGPVDNTTTGLQGPCSGNPCYIAQNLPIDLNIQNPYKGRWLANVIMLQEGKADYTITSNYPIENKPIIKIPDCKDCHNPGATGKTYTKYEIPSWNPGFAHTDSNKDGKFDVQCRSCHSEIHDTNIKKCQDCHTIPTVHPVKEPQFSQYTAAQCLTCHGDTHNVTASSSPDCVSCHTVTDGAPVHVNVSAMNRTDSIHKDLNKDAALVTTSNPENKRCWACHGDGSEPEKHPITYKNPYTCTDCHTGTNPNRNFSPNNTILMVSEHYLGGDQIQTPGVSSCYQCHNKSEMMIAANDPDRGSIGGGVNGGDNSTSHYGKKRTDLVSIRGTRQYCDNCHDGVDSFFDVFTDLGNNTNVQNHSTYGTNPKCQDCHDNGSESRIHDSNLTFSELTLPTSTICLGCHGPGGSATIKDKSKHNNTVDCSVCHLETGKGIHPVKYLNNTGGFSLNKEEGVKCVYCHETGLYGASAIGKLQHSDNIWNGSLWNAGRPSVFWNNNSVNTACDYCHGNSKHNVSALGKLDGIKGSNVANVFGTWCGICHYQGNSQFGSMIGVFSGIGIPPEISKHTTYGNYPSGARDGTTYFNHSLSTYVDTRCDDCHYSGTPSNITQSVHNVIAGGSSCLGCHAGVDVDITKMDKHSNVSKVGSGVTDEDCKGCHFNVLTLGQMVDGYANYSNTYYCQDCHTSGGRNVAQYNNITNVTLRKDGTAHAQANCTSCHIPTGETYHPNGPKGTALDKNCYSCHYRFDGNGNLPNAATVGLNDTPFRAPGEDHTCVSCHDTIARPPLTGLNGCGHCHGATVNNHYVQYGSHYDQTLTISSVAVDTPVSSGSIANVTGTIGNEFVQVTKAQYRIMNSAGTLVIRNWAEMNATDGKFNGRGENIKGRIDTTGLPAGTYKVQVRGMISGYWATGGSGHNAALPYYPDNGLWTSTTSATMDVTSVGTPTPTPTATPNPNPTWSTWTNLGGRTAVTPDIATFNNRLYASVRGFSNGYLHTNSMDTNGIWTGWSPVPMGTFPGALTGSGPSIYTFNNRLYLMATGTDNAIYANSLGSNGAWSTWTNLGGRTAVTPDIAEFNGKLYASVRGFSNGYLHINSMSTSGVWTGWSPVPMGGFPGALVGSGPSIYTFNNRLYLMATGTDNAIYVNSMDTNGVWSGWVNLGGRTAVTPDIAEFNGKLYASVRGFSNGYLHTNSMDTNGIWTGWSPVPMGTFPGALTGSGPSIYDTFNNRLYLMATGTDNAIYVNNLG